MTNKYTVTGMSCQNCANTIERVVGNLDQVETCSVSFATESMTVAGTVENELLIQKLDELGFTASLMDDSAKKKS